jgi:hypothetical protein
LFGQSLFASFVDELDKPRPWYAPLLAALERWQAASPAHLAGSCDGELEHFSSLLQCAYRRIAVKQGGICGIIR